jgi:hypothetical protein
MGMRAIRSDMCFATQFTIDAACRSGRSEFANAKASAPTTSQDVMNNDYRNQADEEQTPSSAKNTGAYMARYGTFFDIRSVWLLNSDFRLLKQGVESFV